MARASLAEVRARHQTASRSGLAQSLTGRGVNPDPALQKHLHLIE